MKKLGIEKKVKIHLLGNVLYILKIDKINRLIELNENNDKRKEDEVYGIWHEIYDEYQKINSEESNPTEFNPTYPRDMKVSFLGQIGYIFAVASFESFVKEKVMEFIQLGFQDYSLGSKHFLKKRDKLLHKLEKYDRKLHEGEVIVNLFNFQNLKSIKDVFRDVFCIDRIFSLMKTKIEEQNLPDWSGYDWNILLPFSEIKLKVEDIINKRHALIHQSNLNLENFDNALNEIPILFHFMHAMILTLKDELIEKNKE